MKGKLVVFGLWGDTHAHALALLCSSGPGGIALVGEAGRLVRACAARPRVRVRPWRPSAMDIFHEGAAAEAEAAAAAPAPELSETMKEEPAAPRRLTMANEDSFLTVYGKLTSADLQFVIKGCEVSEAFCLQV